MKILDLINIIAEKIHAKTYLEIGTQHGDKFYNVKVPHKIGVDINEILKSDPKSGLKFFHMSDKEFFKIAKKENFKYDIIFIDANHSFKQSLFDLKQSINFLSEKGVILMHDVAPPNVSFTLAENSSGSYTGEVWKTLLYLRYNIEDYDFMTWPEDYGLAIIFKKKRVLKKVSELTNISYLEHLKFDYFIKDIDNFMNFRDLKYIKSFFDKGLK